jgi:hypothetical protein
MALEPGGYADKLGNRYEGRWAVRQLLCVLNETIRSVVVEAIGDDQQGVDLCVELPIGVHRAQQCKIRNVSSDKWTIADLSRRGVLSAMQLFLDKNPRNEFAFVTALPSTLLHDLCESSRASADDPELFYLHQIEKIGNERRQAFADVCERLNLDAGDPSDRATVISYLRRLFIELWPDNRTTRDDLLQDAATLINGNPNTAVAVLAAFAQDNLRRTLDATTIWAHLESQDLHPRRLDNDGRVLPAVRELQHRFKDSISPGLIGDKLIRRDETDRLVTALKEHAVVVLHGVPGEGKSGVLYELVEILDRDGIPYLPIRLDRNEPRHTSQQFGRDLELPESPVHCLRALSNDKFGVLILDQLDAIRWTSRHSLNALEVCKSLVREVRGLRELGCQISVVLACRTYDLQNDPQIKTWLRAEQQRKDSPVEIGVSPLAVETVKLVAQQINQNAAHLSQRQIQILQLPQHLAMWVRIVKERGEVEFQNRIQLMREFWADRMRELTSGGIAVSDANSALAAIVGYMEENSSISAPQSVVAEPVIMDALCACGLVRKDGGHIAFSHQSYLDFQIASRVVREIYSTNRSVCDWIGDRGEQSLFRREQLRQALCLLNEDSSDHFLESVKEILANERVRFHLKHLCLEILGQLDKPCDALVEYLDDAVQKEEWKEHILGTVYVLHSPYIERLIESGTIVTWLESDTWRTYGLWILRGIAEKMPDEVARVLRPYLGQDDQWNDRILATMPWHAEDDSADMFTLRTDLARLGVYRDHVNWEKLEAERSLHLLEAVISSWDADDLQESRRRGASRRSRFESWTDRDATALLSAVQADPAKAWQLLMPHVDRLAPLADEPYGVLQRWIEGDASEVRQGMEGVPHGLVQLVIESGRALAQGDSDDYWARTKPLHNHASPVVQYILVETYASLAANHASNAIEWLLADLNRLSIGTGDNEPEWAPAARCIESLSPHCSEEAFHALEQLLIHFHSPDELRNAKYWLTTWKNGFFGDYWGRAQHVLLPALSKARRSKESIGLIGVLDRKFEAYPRERFLRRSKSRGGFVGSTLSASVDRISDKAWLGIVGNKKLALDDGAIKHWYDDHLKESSVRQFSHDLARSAKRFPERFGQLALRFPTDIAPDYRAAILEGLTNTNAKDIPDNERPTWEPASVGLIEKVLASFPRDSTRSYAINFCWLLYYRAKEKWSPSALAQLKDYAWNHPDPESNRLVIGNENGGFDASQSSVANLESNSLNSVRSVAALAIGEQLRNHPTLLDHFRTVLEHLCSDPHPAVSIAGVKACLTLLNSDRDFAIKCFRQATSSDLRVAASRWAVFFFNVGMESNYDQLAPIILGVLNADQSDVVQEGSAEITARWLFHDCFNDSIEKCVSGTIAQRTGVARVAASLVHKPEYFAKCRLLIERLMNDADKDVRHSLREVVQSIDVLASPDGVDLVKTFVQSQAFLDDPGALVSTLRDHTGPMSPFADVLFAICEQFAGPLNDSTRDPAQGTMHDLSEALPMLIRLYEEADEASNTDITAKCLDAFDVMFERRLGVMTELAQIVG